MVKYGSIIKSLLQNNHEELNNLNKLLKKENFKNYVTHKFLYYIFNASLIENNGNVEENFLKQLLLVKAGESKNITIIEIGSFVGLGSKFMVKEIEELGLIPKIHCIDLMYPYFEELSKFNYSIQGIHLLHNTLNERKSGKIFLHSGKSSEIMPILNVKADLIYIDGEHTSGGVYYDLVSSLNHVNDYGIVIIDDIDWRMEDPRSVLTGVRKFLKDYSEYITYTYSLSRKNKSENYEIYEENFTENRQIRQLLLLVKYNPETLTIESIKEKGLYFT